MKPFLGLSLMPDVKVDHRTSVLPVGWQAALVRLNWLCTLLAEFKVLPILLCFEVTDLVDNLLNKSGNDLNEYASE